MIKIKIGKKSFLGVYRWDDITLRRFCDLAAIPMPKGYEAYMLADEQFSTETVDQYIEATLNITEEQLTTDFPIYYRKVIECLTDIPYKTVMLLSSEQANDLYEYYFKPFVISLIYHTPVIHFMGQIKEYEPLQVDKIRIGFKTFILPESINIMGQDIPLANEPIISYSEASDIFKGQKFSKEDVKRLAHFMAIYCRKRGEDYSDKNALERQDIFMKAPMSVVWSVFFYTIQRLPGSSILIQLFGKLPHPIREARELALTYRNMAVEV